MKKMNFLKILMTLVLAFVITGVFAQNDPADYSTIASDPITPNTSYVTQDATIPLYVKPDPNYHTTWTAFSNNLTAGFSWNFYDDASWTDGTEITLAITDNYVEITGNTVGSYPVNVKEQASAAFGGCEDATGVNFTIAVTGKPTAEIVGTNTPANTWFEATAGYEYQGCGTKAAEAINLTFTETGAPAGLQLYAYRVQKRVVILDGSDNEESVVSTTNIINHTIATKGNTGSITTGALSLLTYDWSDGNGLVDSRTLYEYTLALASDAAGTAANGIVSAISHKSDYLDIVGDVATDGGAGTSADLDITTYPFTGTLVVTYIVNPAPKTGPVYHIVNNNNI